MGAHLNILFSNKMLNQKIQQNSLYKTNNASDILIYKDINEAYSILKKLMSGDHSKLFLGSHSDYPLRSEYLDFIYELQKNYYLESHPSFIDKFELIKEKMYLFSSEERSILNNVSTLLFKNEGTLKDIEEHEKHKTIKKIIENTYLGNDSERVSLIYSEHKSNIAIITNSISSLIDNIKYLEKPLKLCNKYLGVNTYIYRYDYRSSLISKENFQEFLGLHLLNPLINKLEINLSSLELKKILNSRIIYINKENFEFSETQHWL